MTDMPINLDPVARRLQLFDDAGDPLCRCLAGQCPGHPPTTIADLARQALQAEDDAIHAALAVALRAGCGVRLTRSPAQFEQDGDSYSATSTLTIEVCPDVPAGEIHEVQGS